MSKSFSFAIEGVNQRQPSVPRNHRHNWLSSPKPRPAISPLTAHTRFPLKASIFSLGSSSPLLVTLSPPRLLPKLSAKGDTAKQVVGLFYNKVLKSTNRRVQTFFAEWQRIFGIVYGQDIGKAEQDAKALGKQFGVKTVPKLKEFLFAVHTYFALLMKLLAAELMTMQSGSMLQSFIQPLGSMSSDDSRRALKDLEDGGLFSRQGINNFLEGDFFAWYLSEWDKAMAQELRGLAKALGSFDPRTPYLAPSRAGTCSRSSISTWFPRSSGMTSGSSTRRIGSPNTC